jgi:hypothetical protein
VSPWLLAAVGVLYVGVAAQYFMAGRPMMALVFAGYALAQLGFVLEAR